MGHRTTDYAGACLSGPPFVVVLIPGAISDWPGCIVMNFGLNKPGLVLPGTYISVCVYFELSLLTSPTSGGGGEVGGGG